MMALETAFGEVQAQFQKLQEALQILYLTLEDKPLTDGAMLVDDFSDITTDLLGWVEEALASAGDGRQAVERSINIDRVRRSLTTCHDRFNCITQRFSSDLASYERVAELVRLGRQRRGEWSAWSGAVKQALDHCQQPLYEVNQALFRCWQELTERAGIGSKFVQTTNIEQQIAMPGSQEVAVGGIA